MSKEPHVFQTLSSSRNASVSCVSNWNYLVISFMPDRGEPRCAYPFVEFRASILKGNDWQRQSVHQNDNGSFIEEVLKLKLAV